MTKEVRIRFRNSPSVYSFLAEDDLELKEGDAVVVDSSGYYQVAFVASGVGSSSARATKWVIQKVDVEGHAKKVLRQTQIALLQKELDKKVKAFKETELLRMVVNSDPSAARLVHQINTLKGGPVAKMQETMWKDA